MGASPSVSLSSQSCRITTWVFRGQPGALIQFLLRIPLEAPAWILKPKKLAGVQRSPGKELGVEGRRETGGEDLGGRQGPGSRGAARAALASRPAPGPRSSAAGGSAHLPGPAVHSRGLSSGAVLPLGWGRAATRSAPWRPDTPSARTGVGWAPRPA